MLRTLFVEISIISPARFKTREGIIAVPHEEEDSFIPF